VGWKLPEQSKLVSLIIIDQLIVAHILAYPLIFVIESIRSYTPLKVLGDGSFATIWLCDWHGTLPPNTPLSPMQCGAGARSEWVGKRLVAIKIIKKKLEGGWDECQNLKEIQVSSFNVF
jgi:serine/threonine protein kinase